MHPTIAFAAMLSGVLALTGLVSGCDQPTTTVQPATVATYTYYVSAATGLDSNPGTSLSPFRTITHALSLAVSGNSIGVQPGLYNATLGEIFPLFIPAGVSLFGNEPAKGAGTLPVLISGVGAIGATGWTGTVVPGNASTLAGFEVTGTSNFLAYLAVDAFSARNNDNITVRNNTFTGGSGTAIYVTNSSNNLIAGNVVQGNASDGLAFVSGGSGTRIENNAFTGNYIGVEFDVPAGDLGGGPAHSAGGNKLSCNSYNDLWTNISTPLYANNNAWDHVPPTQGLGTGLDLYDPFLVVSITTAVTAAGACP